MYLKKIFCLKRKMGRERSLLLSLALVSLFAIACKDSKTKKRASPSQTPNTSLISNTASTNAVHPETSIEEATVNTANSETSTEEATVNAANSETLTATGADTSQVINIIDSTPTSKLPPPPICSANAKAPTSNPDASLALPPHPRLLINAASIAQTISLIKNKDPNATKLYNMVLAYGQNILKNPVYAANDPNLVSPDRLLALSRSILTRVMVCSGIYLLNQGDPTYLQYATRAIAEMQEVVNKFPNWYSTLQFLDTAEMTQAFAIGYDWLYNVLSSEQKTTFSNSIINLGLKAGLDLRPGVNSGLQHKYFTTNTYFCSIHHGMTNWAAVCNAALLNGALAIYEDNPTVAKEVLRLAKVGLQTVSKMYNPDGGWSEGPGYFDYGTKYYVFGLATLKTALGDTWGLEKLPGVSGIGNFGIYVNGPTGQAFNFADAASFGNGKYPASSGSFRIWLGREFQMPLLASVEIPLEISQSSGLNAGSWDTTSLLWYDPNCINNPTIPSTDQKFSSINTAFFRSSWTDKNAFSIAFKGGDNALSHVHFDLGTFVLDALGQRWAMDLGPDSYSLPYYFSVERRLLYYRTRTEGHNTLTISSNVQTPLHFANQNPNAKAKLVGYLSNPPSYSFAVADLSQAYPLVSSAKRGIALINQNQVFIQDEVVAPSPVDIAWNMHTQASVTLQASSSSSPPTAVLQLNGQTLQAQILSPRGAYFEVISANPTPLNLNSIPPENPNTGVSNLTIRMPMTQNATIKVILSAPGNTSTASPPGALSDWH